MEVFPKKRSGFGRQYSLNKTADVSTYHRQQASFLNEALMCAQWLLFRLRPCCPDSIQRRDGPVERCDFNPDRGDIGIDVGLGRGDAQRAHPVKCGKSLIKLVNQCFL